MSFNKNTWSKDYTGAPGLKALAARDAQKKGFSPKSKPASKEAKAPKKEGPS